MVEPTHPQDVDPSDFVLVPREPTEAMIEAMSREWFSIGATGWHSTYAAMVAASPSPSGDVRELLRELEQACDNVAAGRSKAAYLMMIGDGQADALLALDNARRNAREALSKADQIAALYVERIGVGGSSQDPSHTHNAAMRASPCTDQDGEGA